MRKEGELALKGPRAEGGIGASVGLQDTPKDALGRSGPAGAFIGKDDDNDANDDNGREMERRC